MCVYAYARPACRIVRTSDIIVDERSRNRGWRRPSCLSFESQAWWLSMCVYVNQGQSHSSKYASRTRGGGGGGGGGEKNVCVRERLRASALSFLDGDIHPRC